MFNPYSSSLTEQSVNTTTTFEMPPLVNKLFTIMMDDKTHQFVSVLGTLIAIFIMCIWCTQTYKTIKNGGAWPKTKEVIPALLLIVLLSANLHDLTFATKKNDFNVPLHKVVAEDSNRSPMVQVAGAELSGSKLSATDTTINSYIQAERSKYLSSFW
jgi:hypothetical protein